MFKNLGIYIITILFLLADLCAVKLWLVSPAQYLQPYFGHNAIVTGYIDPLSLKQEHTKASFIIECEDVRIGNKLVSYSNKLRVYMRLPQNNAAARKSKAAANGKLLKLQAGRITVCGQIEGLRSFANPGGFDMESYNWVQGIGGMLGEAKVFFASESGHTFLGFAVGNELRLKDYFALINLSLRNLVQSAVKKQASSAILNGMVLGGGSDIPTEIRESFSKNGLSHLLSVSGTHLVLLASFLQLIFKKCSFLRIWQQNLLLLLFLFIYACLCGLKPPVLRALSMSAILLWGQSDKTGEKDVTNKDIVKKSNAMTEGHSSENANKGKLLCVICMMFLIYKPIWILDLGFQLSFGATAGLLWLLPKLKEKLACLHCSWLTEGIAVTLAAQLATLPILIANFYTISLISLASNLLLIPVLELATILTIIGMGTYNLSNFLGVYVLKLAGWLVEQVIVQAQWLQGVAFSNIVIGSLPLFCSALYYAALFSWLDLGPMLLLTGIERKILLFSCCSICIGCYAWENYRPMPTTVYFMDVGQGDGAVIISPEHKAAVIDTGGLKGFDTGSRIVAPLLRSMGRHKIDLVIPSHCDYDHIGGGAGLVRNFEIKEIVVPKERHSEEGVALMQSILQQSKRAKVSRAQAGKVYDLGGTLIKLVSVPKQETAGNDASTVVEVLDVKSGKKVLFTGDMTTKREAELLAIKDYDVLKVGHHGSKGSTSEEFLARIRPCLAVISCGYKNMYGHPHRVILERLHKVGCKVLRTDESGCVQVELTEEGIRVKQWRKWITI